MFLFFNSKHKLHKLKKNSVFMPFFILPVLFISWTADAPTIYPASLAVCQTEPQGIDVKVIEETGD